MSARRVAVQNRLIHAVPPLTSLAAPTRAPLEWLVTADAPHGPPVPDNAA